MTRPTTILLALLLALAGFPAAAQDTGDGDAPSLDELLGTEDDAAEEQPPDEEPQAPDTPELNRELERRLSGQEAADQFAQAVQDMAEAAARLSEERDAGIDTQRLQDEIILKLEQIIASAQNTQEQQSSSSSSSQQQQQARQADRGGQQQQQGEPQQGEQPGPPQGGQPGEGEQPGQEPGRQPGGADPSQGDVSRGSARNAELSMEELREGEWGNLPPRLRDELAESLGESFNPVYRAITEAYYRRIAELSQQEAEDE